MGKRGGYTYHPTRKYLLLCIYIYIWSFDPQNPPHPYSSSLAPHYRSSPPPPILPLGKASATVGYPCPYGFRPSATRIPPHFNPPEHTSDCSLYHTYTSIHLPPSTSSPAEQPNPSSRAASIPSTSSRHPLGSPDPDGPTRARLVWKSKLVVVAGSTRPPHTRKSSGRRSDQ